MTSENVSYVKPGISIAGAGLIGTLWAVLLRQRGYEVALFEKRPDIRSLSFSEERSINLVITSRGLRGLAQANLLDEAIALSVPILGRMVHSRRAGETQFQPYGNADECNFSISRSELNKFLLNAAQKAGVKIYFEHELERIDFEKKILTFKTYHTNKSISSMAYSYDLLFGTDGAGSIVRKNLCKHFPGEFEESIEWLEAGYKELFIPAKEDGSYQINKNALHIWPRGRHMMMALANLDGSFTTTLYMPHQSDSNDQVNFSELTSQKAIENLFTRDFNDAIPLMPDSAKDFIAKPQGKLGTVRCSKWTYQDSVVLMGDAAHAILPFYGQGMNCGFEDCLSFLKILDEHAENWQLAIPQFEKIQKPNTNAIAEMSIENWTEMSDKVGDEKFLFRKKVEALLEKKFPQLFKSRYGMITYTMIPYAVALKIGEIHNQILTKVCTEAKSLDEIPFSHLEEVFKDHLASLIHEYQLTFATDDLVAKMRRNFKDL